MSTKYQVKTLYLPKWWNEARKAHNATIGKQLGHFSNTSDIFFTIFRAEAKILVKAMTNVVTIKTVCWNALTNQVWFQCKRDSSLASSRQTWQSMQAHYQLWHGHIMHNEFFLKTSKHEMACSRERTVQQKVDRSGPVLFSRVRPAIQYRSSTDSLMLGCARCGGTALTEFGFRLHVDASRLLLLLLLRRWASFVNGYLADWASVYSVMVCICLLVSVS